MDSAWVGSGSRPIRGGAPPDPVESGVPHVFRSTSQSLRSGAVLCLAVWMLLCCCEKRLLAAWIEPGHRWTDACCVFDTPAGSPGCRADPTTSCCASEPVARHAIAEPPAASDGCSGRCCGESDRDETPVDSGDGGCEGGCDGGGEGGCDGGCDDDHDGDAPSEDAPGGCCLGCCVKFCDAPTSLSISLDEIGLALPPTLAATFTEGLESLLQGSPPNRDESPPPKLPSILLVSARLRM